MENSQSSWIEICKTTELLEGQIKAFQVQGNRIALCRVQGGGFYAVDDLCTHDDGPLGEGDLLGTEIECPRHGARFDIKTGKALCLPAVLPIKTYPVQITGETVKIQVPQQVTKTP
jgi:3-phenylpropionate/trans-cinnamate dioxygenase ferredoxin subunit